VSPFPSRYWFTIDRSQSPAAWNKNVPSSFRQIDTRSTHVPRTHATIRDFITLSGARREPPPRGPSAVSFSHAYSRQRNERHPPLFRRRTARFSRLPLSFATTHGVSVDSGDRRVLRCFNSPACREHDRPSPLVSEVETRDRLPCVPSHSFRLPGIAGSSGGRDTTYSLTSRFNCCPRQHLSHGVTPGYCQAS